MMKLKKSTKRLLPLLLVLPFTPASALTLQVQVDLPQMQVAEYHAPYVAMWVQGKDRSNLTNLALWYDHAMPKDKGQQWLKDIRQWWRRSGRSLTLPADGITGATRTSGNYTLDFNDKKLALDKLPAGEYKLYIEAVREVGGRELLSIPFTLPIDKNQTLTVAGKDELGNVQLTLIP